MAKNIKGNSLSIGNGISCFIQISPEHINKEADIPDEIKTNGIMIDIGTISNVLYSVQRDVSPNYIAGNRNAVGINKGKRLSTGRIIFSTFDQDSLYYILNEVVTKYGTSQSTGGIKSMLEKGTYFQYNLSTDKKSIDVGTGTTATADQDAQEIRFLDELPPVNIIFTGIADDVARVFAKDYEDKRKFRRNVRYKMELNGVKFLGDSFGIAAGSPLSDQVVDIMILGNIKPWAEF